MFNMPERGHSNGVFEKQQFLHSQKLHTVVGQNYHPEWYFLTHPTRTIGLKNAITLDISIHLAGSVSTIIDGHIDGRTRCLSWRRNNT